ncbi:MAG: TonB-dependent receptor [Gammaproteobacteria bacterium]|nr:TonB-dependent receptor [Gammaproteobacteria bacterium]
MKALTEFKTFALSLAIVVSVAMMPSTALPQDEETIEEVVVTGTRVEGRSATESLAPVDIITEEMIRSTGATETGKILQLLAPSFNFSSTTISDGTDMIRPATLRGLGPDQLLVLVNGKRRHPTAHVNIQQTVARGDSGTDINAIPASAIKRIEVLRDGASAQYGSDAIAGVINIVLKDNIGTELSAQWGSTTEGDGETLAVSVNAGFEIGEEGFVNFTFEYRDREETNRATPAITTLFGWYPAGVTDTDLRSGAVMPEVKLRIGDSDSENIGFFYNAALPTASGEFYSFGGYTNRDGDASGFFRGPGDNRTVPALYPNGFLPNIITELTDWSVVAGYRGDINDTWDWDLSLAHGSSKFDFQERNTVNVSWWFEPLDGMDAANGIFAESPQSGDTGNLLLDQTVLNFDVRGSREYGAGKLLNIAVGIEYREDDYEIEAGDPLSYTFGRTNDPAIPIFGQTGGAASPATQGFPGFSPTEVVDDGRNSFAVYGDLESYVTDTILLGGALRYEDFSDFGSTLDGKLSARVNFNERVSLRGTVATGFRAPGVQQTFFSQKSTNLDASGTLADTLNGSRAVAQALGFADLREETSIGFTAGLVLQPSDAFSFTIDVYRIEIDDRIIFSSTLAPESTDAMGNPCVIGTGNCPIADVLSSLNVAQTNLFTNAVDTSTDGVDLVAKYTMDLNNGAQFDFNASVNFTSTDVDRINSSSSILSDTQVFDSGQVLLVEEGQPGEHGVFSGTYYSGPWTINARANYFGEVSSKGFTGVEHTWGAKTLVDAHVSYDFSDNVRFTVGGNNIFDTFPDDWGVGGTLEPPGGGAPFDDGVTFGDGGFKYGWETLPFGINGASYYIRLDVSM